MYKRRVTERRRGLPHRHESVVKTLVKSTAMALGITSLLWGGAAFGEAPDEVKITDLKWAGSGCPAGSVASSVAPDREAFTLAFAEYIASVGPGIPITDNRKNCNLILRLSFPPGWSFTIFTVDYRGFADLDEKVTGTQRSAYFFEGEFPSAALRSDFVGPFTDNYEIRDTLGLVGLPWSPCDGKRALNINTEVRVSNQKNKKGFGLITTDTITGVLDHIYGIKWRRC